MTPTTELGAKTLKKEVPTTDDPKQLIQHGATGKALTNEEVANQDKSLLHDRTNAIKRYEKHLKILQEAYDAMTEAERQGRGTPAFIKANTLANKAEQDLWDLLAWFETVTYKGIGYTRDGSMNVSRTVITPL